MKGAAEFFLDMLITDPETGWLVTAPSNSPENNFITEDGEVSSICMGPTHDMQLLRELFGNCIEATRILGIDSDFRRELIEAREKLAPYQIGKHGQIQEWLKDYKEQDPNHRHVSHLYGLHPYDEITVHGTPELAEAARVTLERRGDKSTGWSMAWKANFWARLHEGDRARHGGSSGQRRTQDGRNQAAPLKRRRTHGAKASTRVISICSPHYPPTGPMTTYRECGRAPPLQLIVTLRGKVFPCRSPKTHRKMTL
jgi:hypothetical protein